MTNDDPAAKLRQSWTTNAGAWTDAVRGQKIESRRLATDAAILAAILDLHPATVLDLGCGEGWLTRALTAHGVQATGVDASPELIHAAQELGGGTFQTMSYAELDQAVIPSVSRGTWEGGAARHAPDAPPAQVPRLDARDDRYDVIAANFSLLEEDLRGPLSALRARLNPGGALIVQTVHPAFAGGDYVDGWRVETFAAMPGEWHDPMPWYFRTLSSWTRTFVEAGYVVTDIREPLHPQELRPLSIVFTCRGV